MERLWGWVLNLEMGQGSRGSPESSPGNIKRTFSGIADRNDLNYVGANLRGLAGSEA